MDVRLARLEAQCDNAKRAGRDLGYERPEWAEYSLVEHFCAYFVSTINAKVPVFQSIHRSELKIEDRRRTATPRLPRRQLPQ